MYRVRGLLKTATENKEKIYISLYFIMVILLSRNTMISSTIIGFTTSNVLLAIATIPIFCIFISKAIKQKIDRKQVVIILPLILAIILSVIVKQDWQMYNVSILFYIVASILLASIIDFQYLKKLFINLFFVLAIISLLVTYVAKPIFINLNIESQLENIGLVITNSVGYNFLNLGLGFAMFQENYYRNYGIFTEPNFFQFYLIIAVIMLLFLKEDKIKKIDYLKLGIIIVTIISTFSTAAIITLAIIVLVKILQLIVNYRKDKKKLIAIIIICLIACICLVSIKSVREYVMQAYNKVTTLNDSSVSRFGSLDFTINKTIQSPIFGNKIADILSYENLLTNTTFSMSAVYGIIPLIYSIYLTYRFARTNQKNNLLLTLVISVIIILAYNSHLYIGVQSFWMILLSTVSLIRKEDEKNEKEIVVDS